MTVRSKFLIKALLLPDVFNNFRNMCPEIYGLDPGHFLSAPGLTQKVVLKKTKVKLEILTVIDMQLMVENDIRQGIYHAIYQ